MDHWIERLSTPRLMFLAWQAPDHLSERFRWVVGKLTPYGMGLSLQYFQDSSEFRQINQGRTMNDLERLGFRGYPGLRPGKAYKDVLPAFLRRLPPYNRSDFNEYKRQFRIPPYLRPSPIEMLALTEAKLPSDGFSVVDPLDPFTENRDLFSEIAGFRYYEHKLSFPLSVGERVRLISEFDNQFDREAVKISARSTKIGNINRLQAPTLRYWLANRNVEAWVERVDRRESKPRAFIFLRVRSS